MHANVAIADIESWTQALRSTLLRLLREEAGQHGWTVEVRSCVMERGIRGDVSCLHVCVFDSCDGVWFWDVGR